MYLALYGHATHPVVFTPAECDALLAALAREEAQILRKDPAAETHAMRDLLRVPEVRALANDPRVRALVEVALGPSARAVRGLFFDKVPGANWKVAWHQDTTIAVQAQQKVPGFGPWSVKFGVPHVRPPASVLENMLAVRVHLDDCGEDNGPLRVSPGTHLSGVLDAADFIALRARHGEFALTCPRGGAILMKPLLLHASSPATNPRHRRVIHLEFAAGELPAPLAWHERA